MKTLYISDLDGTLLTSGGVLSATSITLLNHAISRGAIFSVATARTPATVSKLLAPLHLKVPLVVMTGASLWDSVSGKYSDIQHFTPEQVKAIVKAYTSPKDGGGFLYTLPSEGEGEGKMAIYHIGEFNEVERGFMMERIDSPFKKFMVSDTGASQVPARVEDAILFFGMRGNEVADEILKGLRRVKGINPMYYHDWYGPDITEIEAFPAGATKALAVKRLKRLVGAERLVVFGDNYNDLSMMKEADWSVAVANAVPAVKEAADEVIGSNDADAVPRYILEDFTVTG